MVVDDALRVAGRARRVEQRERVPLVERPRPRERRVAFGEQRLLADAAEPLAARALRIVDVDDDERPITLQHYTTIASELKTLYSALESRDMAAGSAVARRLFQ